MTIVKDKKIPAWVTVPAVYLSYCFATFMPFRGVWAALLSGTSVGIALDNYIVTFFLGGLIPFGLYEMITRFAFRFMQVRIGGDSESLRYALRFFYVPANIVIGLLKLTYLAAPVFALYGDLIFDFVVTAAFFVGFLFYAVKSIPKERISTALYLLGGTFIIVYGFIELINIIVEVLL